MTDCRKRRQTYWAFMIMGAGLAVTMMGAATIYIAG